jgi:hypothetical protein
MSLLAECLLTKFWSGDFCLGGIDKKFFCIHNTSYHDIGDGLTKCRERLGSAVEALWLVSPIFAVLVE